MPTIVWLMAGAGMWLTFVSAVCMMLTVAARADATHLAAGDRTAGGRWVDGELLGHDPAGLLGPPITGIVLAGPEPGRTRPISASAPGGPQPRPPERPPGSTDVDRARSHHSYALHAGEAVVARLRWQANAGQPAGWYLCRPRGRWRRLAVDPDLDAGGDGLTAHRPGWQQTSELAAYLSTALALDAAADLLHGPPASPPRRLRTGRYELHAAGLPPEIATIAFPEAVTVSSGDTTVLTGHFDDRGLTVLTRRIAILGGRILAIFCAGEPHTPHAPE